jgi:2-furoyl-CoA dehydrogenase 2Fe-2S iron sulfur subunit
MLLSDFLRENFGLMSVHAACEHGVCGACTLSIDGRPARSCLRFAVQVDGRRVDTVEGLAQADGELSDLQAAFRRHHALQCGYCTPGILMSVEAFLENNADPSEEQIRDMLSGHLCRCTGYVGMVRAIQDAAARRNQAQVPAV